MRRLALAMVLVLAGGAVLGACDAFTDDDETQGERTDAGQTDDERTDDGGGDDQALAEAIVLTLDDLPEGFTESTDDDDETDEATDEGTDGGEEGELSPADEQFEECADPELVEELEALDAGEGEGGSAENEFDSEADFQFVSSAAYVAPDPELPTAIYELFTSECVSDAFLVALEEEAAGDDTQFTDASVEPIEGLPDVGDAVGGFALRATAGDASGLTFELAFDFVIVQSGRAVAFALVGGVFEPFPTAERDALLELMAERMEPAA